MNKEVKTIPTQTKLLAIFITAILALLTTVAVFAATSPNKVEYIEPLAHTTMQTFDTNDCAAMPKYSTLELTDTRNGQKYRVRKMPDNKCWMIDNMKLAGVTLTNTDSNITDLTYNLMAISATHGTVDDTPYVDDPAINSPLKNNCINNMGTSPDSLTGCGYLYSWSAATAGTGNGISSGDATGSICPINWRLPTGTATGDFAVLNGSMLAGTLAEPSTENTDTSRANWWSTGIFSGSYAGNYYGSTWGYQGNNANWWSSTVNSGSDAYFSGVSYNSLGVGASITPQYYGFSVRCVLN